MMIVEPVSHSSHPADLFLSNAKRTIPAVGLVFKHTSSLIDPLIAVSKEEHLMTAERKRVLLAYTGLPLARDVFKLACLYAKDSAADLQLLRIHLPEDVITERVHAEQLYSEMKTLYAQLQQAGILVELLAEPGRAEEPVLNYLARHPVDLLIFVGKKGSDGRLEDEEDEVMHTLIRNARCTSMMVA